MLILVRRIVRRLLWPNSKVPLIEPVQDIVYLDQGWGKGSDAPERQTFYYTPQGTSIKGMRYSWFVNLERPWGEKRFADPDHMREFGFLVDLKPSPANPHQLPVGFTHHFACELQDDVLDLTCAGCHTGQVSAWKDGKRIAIRIDGGAAMHAFTDMKPGDFLPDLILAMTATYVNPFKFNRFAKNVLGEEHYADGKKALRIISVMCLGKAGWNDLKASVPGCEGYGRTDAISRISTPCSATTFRRRTIARRRAGGYPPLGHLEVRLGALRRVGASSVGAKCRRGHKSGGDPPAGG